MQKIREETRKLFWSSVFLWLFFSEIARAQDVTAGTPPPPTSFTLPSPLSVKGGIIGLVEAILNNIVLPLGASVAAIAIIYSGFLYVKAQGNKSELEKAHEAIKWSIVGTAVILGAWALAQLIKGTIDALRVGGA